jgi:sigma-B regulation protein RsbU (phosphoserine phosphatase)
MATVGALTAETKYRLLLTIAQKISGTLDLHEILDHILDTVRTVVDYDAAGIFVLAHDDPFLRFGESLQVIAGMASRGFELRPLEEDDMLRLGKGIVGHVVETQQPVIAPDVAVDPHYIAGRRATRAEIAVPVTIEGRVVGALNLESDTLGAYRVEDLEALRFFADAAGLSIEKAMLHRELIEKRRIESQLQIAHDVQSRLLPAAPPALPGYDIAGVSLPSDDIGGDYFDYLPLPGNRLGLVVADVAGKGIPAALIMSAFRTLVRLNARREPDVAEAMRGVNRFLAESADMPSFVTAVYGVLDVVSGRFVYSNCGHNPPLLFRESGREEELTAGGPFLGVFDSSSYDAGDVDLEPGDVLVLYTDGVIETGPGRDNEFGVARLASVVRETRAMTSARIIEEAIQETRRFSGRTSYTDDFTIMVVKRI